MNKYFYYLGIITFVLFLLSLFSYEKLENFDRKMSDLLFDNDFLIAFHFFGETKLIIFLALTLIVSLFFIKNFRGMLFVVLTVGIGSVINKIVKNWVERPRPDIVDQLSSYSFPSAHAMLSLLTYFTICFLLLSKVIKRKSILAIIWGVAIVITLLTGLSRVAESRHYATDVLAGWCLGYTWFVICAIWYNRKK